MSEYRAPLKDMEFVVRELCGLDQLGTLPGNEDFGAELLLSVLEQAGTFAAEVLAPLNMSGDQIGSHLEGDVVVTPPGWKSAYQRFIENGWNGLACKIEHDGQGLPTVVSALTQEMWHSANASFGLCPMLTQSAIAALEASNSKSLRETYLPKMVSGVWTGTMNLTEPQAGSDLAAIKTRAILQSDGSYRINGQKIFITYGDHDLAENIVHLVLARTPHAPEGVKGISLFVVPKILVNEDGSLGLHNAVSCVSLEHKLGIHASPTCVMQFGDQHADGQGAIGWLVGEENRGLEYMFIMMNDARFSVGLQGIGLAERAYQHALDYARTRFQGTNTERKSAGTVAIIQHPDVRRMLLTMKSTIEAMRALACVQAVTSDTARLHPNDEVRTHAQARLALMTPIIKGWCTESAVNIASLGIQIHGGMGYVEETGAAQFMRDARITTIYEGTTGIQAADLVGRKIIRDGGEAATALLAEIELTVTALRESTNAQLRHMGARLQQSVDDLGRAVQFIVTVGRSEVKRALSGADPLLRLFGIVGGGWQLARAAVIAQRRLDTGSTEREFYNAKLSTASFFIDNILCHASALAYAVINGADSILGMDEVSF